MGINVVTDKWIMKKRNIQNFEKALSFSVMTPKKKKERNSRNLETETDLDLDGGKKGEREKENRNWMY